MDDTSQVPPLLEAFCEAAIRKGEEDVSTEEDQRLYARMAAIVADLRAMSPAVMTAFRVLLRHESSHVQLWVAAELLSESDADAKRTLEQLAARPGLIGLHASLVLDEFGAGQYTSPFSR